MNVSVANIAAIVLSIFVTLVILFALAYRYFTAKRGEQQSAKFDKSSKPKGKVIRQRPTPLKLHEIRYKRVPSQSQFTPLVITPTTPNLFTIPPSRAQLEGGRSGSVTDLPSPHGTNKTGLSPSPRFGHKGPALHNSPKLLRTMSEGAHCPAAYKTDRVPPHGKIECFLKHEEETNCLFVQVKTLNCSIRSIQCVIQKGYHFKTSATEFDAFEFECFNSLISSFCVILGETNFN